MKHIFFLMSFILSILTGCEKSDIFDDYVPISHNYDAYYFRVNKSQDTFIIGDFIYKSQSKTGKLMFTKIE